MHRFKFEDDDLLLRCTEQKVFTDFELYDVSKESTSGLYLHGDESYIESTNNIKLNQDFTIHITFRPDEIIPEYDRAFDEYCVFSIPGWDTTISYNSFNRYKFECWDIGKECHQITSDYDYPKLTRITITYRSGDRLLTMYQDGEEIGHRRMTRRILDTEEDKFYIGVASIEREDDKKSFRGYVSDFAYWETCLEKNEVREINENSGMSFLYDNNQYGSSNRLKLYYDFKHSTFNNSYDYGKGSVVDLVHPRHYGNIYNCIPKNHKEIEKKRVSIPVRRKSTFEVLHHDNEGYGDGGWKYQSTRLNQIRYYDRVLNNRTKLHNDGLSNLKYQTNSRSADENYTILSVNLDP